MSPTTPPVQPARAEHHEAVTLNDRYQLTDVVGSGGMGRVWRAHDTRLDRDVAVKILRGDKVGDSTARARLEAEARLAAGLDHPAIASIYDYDEDQASEHRDPFIVMQLVEGRTLGQVLHQEHSLEEAQVRSILVGLADALAVSHAAGIVHRDIKPSNIVLNVDGHPVLVDFGIATSASIDPLTETGVIVGTMEYLSPEQARGRPSTAASDVYSLGVVAAQCLSGTSPFQRESAVATAMAQVSDDLPALPPTVSSSLARLVRSMTHKDPDQRPSAELVADTARSAITRDDLGHRPRALPLRPRGGGRRSLVSLFAGVGSALAVIAASGATAILLGGGGSVMPDVVGLSADRAASRVEDAGAAVKEVAVDRPTAKAGTVVAQNVEAGEPLESDSVVTLQVATGRMNVEASAIEGKSVAKARALLERSGFVVAVKKVTSSRPTGTVIDLDRSGRLPVGTTITLSVATAASGSTTSSTGGTNASTDPPKGAGSNNGKAKGKGRQRG